MKIFNALKEATSLLSEHDGYWAICGGIAAAIYRQTPRFTADIDIAIINSAKISAKEISAKITTALGYNPIAGYVTDKNGHLIPAQALVLGREDQEGSYVGIDFLLPVLPWIDEAVARAQINKIDFGFNKLPTITLEDLCIAKLFAFEGTPTRKNDLDDIIEVLKNARSIDKLYLKERINKYDLKIPDEVILFLS